MCIVSPAEEHLAELMPIFEQLRAKGEVGNVYPMQVGSTSGPTVYMAHGNGQYSCHLVIIHVFRSVHRFFTLFWFCCHCCWFGQGEVVSNCTSEMSDFLVNAKRRPRCLEFLCQCHLSSRFDCQHLHCMVSTEHSTKSTNK